MSTLRWLIPAVLALSAGLAAAQDRGPGGHDRGPGHDRPSAGARPGPDRPSPGPSAGPRPGPRPGFALDARYHHDHYYPAPGYVARGLPVGATFIGGRYWYHGGVWYQPYGPSFRVIAPPIGVVIPFLPSAYVTLRIGGLPYYYANGAYYEPYSAGPGYVVVTPPPNAETVQPATVSPTPPKPDPIIYPRNGQSSAQTEADRQECNRWATTQPAAMNDASVFNRAVEACMDGRGYSMR